MRRKHERIHHIFGIIAERVGRCTRTQQRRRCSIAHDDFVRSRVEDGPADVCNAIHEAWLGPRSQSVSTRLGNEWTIHQFCGGRGGTGIAFPAAKLIISVLARVRRACCWNRSWRVSIKGRQGRWRRILGCKIGFVKTAVGKFNLRPPTSNSPQCDDELTVVCQREFTYRITELTRRPRIELIKYVKSVSSKHLVSQAYLAIIPLLLLLRIIDGHFEVSLTKCELIMSLGRN